MNTQVQKLKDQLEKLHNLIAQDNDTWHDKIRLSKNPELREKVLMETYALIKKAKKLMVFVPLLFLLSAFTGQPETDHNLNEAINDLEDMVEWTLWDIEEGYIDQERGNALILNMEQTIEKLRQVK